MNIRHFSFSCLIILGLLFLPVAASGQAFRFQSQSASAAGQGNVFVADASDPSAIHYNPAGMTQLHGIQGSGGSSFVGSSITYKGSAGVMASGDFGGLVAIPPPSHGYITVNLRDVGISAFGDLSAGIGITTPFGLQTRYPTDGPFRTAVTGVNLPMFDIKPTLAYRLKDCLSIGVGADIYTFASFLGEGQVEQRFVWPGGGGIPAGATAEINGKGTAAGFNVSFLYTPFRNGDGKPLVNIGFVYRHQATMDLDGAFLVSGTRVADARTTVTLPSVYTGGIAVWPMRDAFHEWKLELDVDFVEWQSVRNLDTHLSTGGILPQPANWRNVVVILLGTEYRWLKPAVLPDWELTLRTGYSYTPTPIPDATFNPGILGLDLHEFSVGAGLTCKDSGRLLGMIPCRAGTGRLAPKAFGIDFAYRGWFFEPRTVTGNLNPTVDGNYQAIAHVGIVTLRVVL